MMQNEYAHYVEDIDLDDGRSNGKYGCPHGVDNYNHLRTSSITIIIINIQIYKCMHNFQI